MRAAGGVPDDAAPLVAFDCAGASQRGKVPGDDGEIDRATFGQLGDRTWTPALDQTGEQPGPRGVGQGLEQLGIEQSIDRCPLSGGLPGSAGLLLAYLRHHASIADKDPPVKSPPKVVPDQHPDRALDFSGGRPLIGEAGVLPAFCRAVHR